MVSVSTHELKIGIVIFGADTERMANSSKAQVANLTFAWLGALLALLYCVEQDVPAHLPFASIGGIALTLGIAIVLLALLRRDRPEWAIRSLCFALGSSCSIITVLAVS